ncbi:MAG TPA: glycine cleavage system aminomethyltransferase GcvT [Trebonia sp.]|nr:glycine cleavage system aminomethyltransferase GcvT [Trebonia sp.]
MRLVTSTVRDTPLRAVHERLGATMTEFAGWLMPLRYGSETAEHNAVRTSAALFDLSHMGEIAVTGPGAGAALDYAVCGWPSQLSVGRARYTMLCAPDGGVLDDLIIYRQAADRFLVVANAANTAVVLGELRERCSGGEAEGSSPETVVTDESAVTGLVSIQGPNGCGLLSTVTDLPLSSMPYYSGAYGTVAGREAWVARTGYTGEDGFEIFCAPGDCEPIWDALTATVAGGLPAAGLAARDTLRLEAGMPLYGNELGPDVTPYEAGLGRVVRLDKPGDFVGRSALAQRAAEGPRRTLIGLLGKSRRVPRHGYAVLSLAGPSAAGDRVGVVTSGAPSPTLGRPIAMAYVEVDAGGPFGIDVRGNTEPAEVTGLPFYDRRK